MTRRSTRSAMTLPPEPRRGDGAAAVCQSGMRVFFRTVKRSCSSSDLLIFDFQVSTANIGDGFIRTPKWQKWSPTINKLHCREGQLCILCVLEAGRHSEYIRVVGCSFAPFFGGTTEHHYFAGSNLKKTSHPYRVHIVRPKLVVGLRTVIATNRLGVLFPTSAYLVIAHLPIEGGLTCCLLGIASIFCTQTLLSKNPL